MIGAADAAASVDEGIEHQIEELVGQLEADPLRAGRGFARKLVQGVGEIAAGQTEQRHEARREPTAIVEEVVDGVCDVELIDCQRRRRRCRRLSRRGGRRWPRRWSELSLQFEHRSVAAIAQARLEVCREAEVVSASNVPTRPPAAIKMV